MLTFEIHIDVDPIYVLENHFRAVLEEEMDLYPTLTDFNCSAPIDTLEKNPIIPCFLTFLKLKRQLDVTPFLLLQKPILNLPQTEQKELIRYLKELSVEFIPQHVKGNNVRLRNGALQNGTGFYQTEIAESLIRQFELPFTEKDIDVCPKCEDKECSPHTPICPACNDPIFRCEYKAGSHQKVEKPCEFCGETYFTCFEHSRSQSQKTCSVHRRKSEVSTMPTAEAGENVSAVPRQLLYRLKKECSETLKEIRNNFPTLTHFHTRNPNTFLAQYPILTAILTFIKVKSDQKNPMLFRQVQLSSDDQEQKFVSAMRDITAAEWGETLADTSTTAFIKELNLSFSVADIDTCPKCNNPECSGDRGFCFGTKVRGQFVSGCEKQHYGCEISHHILTCKEPQCQQIYRQCVGHTCNVT